MKKILLASISLLTPFLLSAQIDRDKMPEPTQMPTFTLGEPHVKKLPNGLTLMVVENHKLPHVSVSLTLDRPPIDETQKPGMYYLTSELMGGGSKNISKEAFVEETDRMGATVYLTIDGGNTYSLTRYFPRVLELFAEAALHPNFTQAEPLLHSKQKRIVLRALSTVSIVLLPMVKNILMEVSIPKNPSRVLLLVMSPTSIRLILLQPMLIW